MLIVRIAVFAVAIALIIWGILNGGAGDVLAKAVAICTECIGLG
ncbi:MAG TPA: thioredoxin [Candidatus Gallimonas intestinigallinarum]|uniref:Thioredoxin n=1 Tax=Candidatus Gallimonas intestinigallinarum TaxID=2838604 RepID=A0A9D2DWL3_9FIRM|nr:thioredoxin [Candidatus Gallimonas intestinigallinarum]